METSIFSQVYIRFRGNELGSMLHLNVMIGKDENDFICSCITCVTEMIHNLTVTLPGFCKSNVCLSFSRCYSRILYMLDDVKAMNLKSSYKFVNYTKFHLTREDIHNKRLNCFLLSLRIFNAFCFR